MVKDTKGSLICLARFCHLKPLSRFGLKECLRETVQISFPSVPMQLVSGWCVNWEEGVTFQVSHLWYSELTIYHHSHVSDALGIWLSQRFAPGAERVKRREGDRSRTACISAPPTSAAPSCLWGSPESLRVLCGVGPSDSCPLEGSAVCVSWMKRHQNFFQMSRLSSSLRDILPGLVTCWLARTCK